MHISTAPFSTGTPGEGSQNFCRDQSPQESVMPGRIGSRPIPLNRDFDLFGEASDRFRWAAVGILFGWPSFGSFF